MAEIMKDAELDAVVGGSGIECMGLMVRLQSEGLAKFNTPLVAGNEVAAAAELKDFLGQFVKSRGGDWMKLSGDIYSDARANSYYQLCHRSDGVEARFPLSVDELVQQIREMKG